MSVTFRIPGNPITNGITPIQTTNFNPVTAHWIPSNHAQCMFIARSSGKQLPLFFPKAADPSWTAFMVRNVLLTEPSQYTPFMGWKVFLNTSAGQIYNPDLARLTQVQLQKIYLQTYTWYMDVQTDTVTSAEAPQWAVVETIYPITVNMQTGDRFSNAYAYNMLQEQLGFSFTQVAAGYPTDERAQKRASGLYPW